MLPPVIIASAGNGERWQNHLGVGKWMVPIDGRPLIHRTALQLLARGFDDVRIFSDTCDHVLDGRCRWVRPTMPSSDVIIPHTPFAHTLPVWPESFLLLMGDVYFTEGAIDRICTHVAQGRLTYIARGIWRGIHSPETFGLYVPASERARVAQALAHVAANLPGAPQSAQWMTYRQLHGFPLDQHCVNFSKGFLHLDDATEDFDSPECFEHWRRDWGDRLPVQTKPPAGSTTIQRPAGGGSP